MFYRRRASLKICEGSLVIDFFVYRVSMRYLSYI